MDVSNRSRKGAKDEDFRTRRRKLAIKTKHLRLIMDTLELKIDPIDVPTFLPLHSTLVCLLGRLQRSKSSQHDDRTRNSRTSRQFRVHLEHALKVQVNLLETQPQFQTDLRTNSPTPILHHHGKPRPLYPKIDFFCRIQVTPAGKSSPRT